MSKALEVSATLAGVVEKIKKEERPDVFMVSDDTTVQRILMETGDLANFHRRDDSNVMHTLREFDDWFVMASWFYKGDDSGWVMFGMNREFHGMDEIKEFVHAMINHDRVPGTPAFEIRPTKATANN